MSGAWYYLSGMSLLLICLFAVIVLVIAVCIAVRFCNLENVDLSANITRFAAVRFSVTGRPPPHARYAKPRVPIKQRNRRAKPPRVKSGR